MTIESFDLAHGAIPFRPYSLEMKDGRTLAVPAARAIAHKAGSRLAVLVDARGGCEAIDLAAVVSLDYAKTEF